MPAPKKSTKVAQSPADQVIACVKKLGQNVKRADIAAATKLKATALSPLLARLVAEKKLTKSGVTRGTTYSVA